MHKYILGWIDIVRGKREEFLAGLDTYIATTRAEPGCLFFEMSASRDNADVVLLMECFTDEAAHKLHSETAHQDWMRQNLKEYMTGGRFELVYSDRVEREAPRHSTG
jgi:quinol monooxygenase YgiN